MDQQDQKTVLLDVEVGKSIDKAIEKLGELSTRIKALKEQQKAYEKQLKDGKISLGEYTTQTADINATIKALSSITQQYSGLLKDNIKQYELTDTPMNQLSARLSTLKRVYRDLSAEQRNDPLIGGEIRLQAKALNDTLKELEAGYGQFGRNVGNYNEAAQIVTGSMQTELRKLTEQLSQLALSGQKGTQEYEQLVKKASQIRDAIADTRKDINQRADDNANINALVAGIQVLTSSITIFQSALGLSNDEAEEFAKTVQKIQLLMGALHALQTINNLTQKQAILITKTRNALNSIFNTTLTKQLATENLAIASTKKHSIALAAQNTMTKAATIATNIWNNVLKANPILLIVSAIITLLTVGYKLIKMFSSSAKAMRTMEDVENKWTETMEKNTQTIEKLETKRQTAIDKTNFEQRKRIIELKRNGATEKQIADETYKYEIKKLNITIQTTEQLVQQYTLQRNQLIALAKVHAQALSKLDKDSDKYKQAKEKLTEYNNQIKELNNNIIKGNNAITDAKLSKQEKQLEKQPQKQTKTSTGESPREKQYKKEKALLEQQIKLQEKNQEIEKALVSDSITEQIDLEDRHQQQKQQNQLKTIELERKYNKITESQAQNKYELLAKEDELYHINRQKKLTDYLNQELAKTEKTDQEKLNQLKQQNQIAITEYEKALKKQAGISDQLYTQLLEKPTTLPGFSNDLLHNYQNEMENIQRKVQEYSITLYNQELAEQDRINKESLTKRLEQQMEIINQKYNNDLIKFSENEQKKTEIEIKRLQEIINLNKQNNQDVTEQEQELNQLQAKQRKLNLDNDLILNLKSQQEIFNAKKEYYIKEIELAKDNQAKRKELENELLELEKQNNLQRIELFNNYTTQVSTIATNLNSLLSAQEQAKTQEYETQTERKKELLQNQLSAGIISQTEYDNEIANLDAQLDKKKQKLSNQQALREKKLKTYETIINTASAIMKVWAEMDPISAAITSAIVATTGAIQLATINKTPLPKAEKGGLIKGKRHSQGGTIIEAEDGEMIINRKSTQKYSDLLQAINNNNIKPIGIKQNNNEMLQLQQAIKDLKVYVSVEDINRGQKNYAKIQNNANF